MEQCEVARRERLKHGYEPHVHMTSTEYLCRDPVGSDVVCVVRIEWYIMWLDTVKDGAVYVHSLWVDTVKMEEGEVGPILAGCVQVS